MQVDLEDLEPWLRAVLDDYYGQFPEPGGSASYGQLVPPEHRVYTRDKSAELWVEPPECSFGDYASDSVWRSNQRTFLRLFPDDFCTFYGGHGSQTIACPVSRVTPGMLEMFNALTEYPILDEMDESEVRMELTEEAWSGWAEWTFICEVLKRLEPLDGAPQEDVDWFEKVDDQLRALAGNPLLFDWFEDLREQCNKYWENFSEGMHTDVGSVADEVTREDLDEFLASVE
jgi:hypothetical protein